MWRSRWRCVIKPAYSVSFLLSINIFVWQNVLYFPNDLRITLKVRAVWTVETSVIIYQSTRRHIPNGLNCQQLLCENIKFPKFNVQPFRWAHSSLSGGLPGPCTVHTINSETCYGTETRKGIRKKYPVFVDKASFSSRIHKHRTWEPLAQSGCNVLLDLAPNFHLFPLLIHHLRGRRFTKLSWRLITQLTIFQLLPLAASRIMPKVNIFPNKTTRTLILLRVTNMKKVDCPLPSWY